MSLPMWCKSLQKPNKKSLKQALAQALGCAESTAKSYLNGNRAVPAQHFRKVELFTQGEVTQSQLLAAWESRNG